MTVTWREILSSFKSFMVALMIAALVAILTPWPLDAQPQVYLEDAVQSGQVEALITGKSISFAEPMLSLRLQNTTASSFTVLARAGLELISEDPAYADIVVGKASMVPLQAEEERSVDLYAFSLDLTRSFPPPEMRYSIKGMSNDTDLLSVLERVSEQHVESDLAAQLAVWMQAMSYSFDQIEEALGVSLNKYEAKALNLLGLAPPIPEVSPTVEGEAPTRSPVVTGTPVGETATPLGIEPTPTSRLAPEEISEPVLIAGVVATVALAAMLVYVSLQRRKQSLAEPPGRPDPRRAPASKPSEERCIVCNRPLSQCICAGRVQRERRIEERPAPRLELEKRPPVGKTAIIKAGARLVAVGGDCVGHEYALPDRGDILLSRDKLPFIAIPLPAISAPHALLFLDERPFRIKDLNSSNGTTVGGQELPTSPEVASEAREIPLRDGAQITFGNLSFAFKESPLCLQDEQGKTYRLPVGSRVIVTRLPLSYLQIKESTVSAPHALVRREAEQYIVKDLNSGNGTELGVPAAEGFDYQLIASPVGLKDRQRLRLGHAVLEMRGVSGPAPAARDLKHIGPYEIVGTIGVGGMARVLEGQSPERERVAVKVPRDIYAYDESFRRRFDREARSMRRLDHPNIVRIIDVGEDRSGEYLVGGMGLQYIAVRYVDGCSLDRLLAAGRSLEERVVAELVRCVAEALQHAHERGVVHRDVKPSNILISHEGQVFITDFGIARAKGEATITQPGERPGSPHYISPEQAAGRGMDKRSDIYSLGVVIYQMITGRVPFDGDAPVQTILIKHQTEPPVPPEEIRPDVPRVPAAIALKCLEKAPAERYQSAQEIVDRLPLRPSAAGELAKLVAEATSREKTSATAHLDSYGKLKTPIGKDA